jgi:OFA family oxalate/formate antiporter-like MFS transporter
MNMPRKTFYYGYVIVAAATIILMVAYSSHYAYSIFFDSLAAYFQTTKATISGAFSLTVIISGVLGMFAGSLSDRIGPKKITIICGSSLGLAFLAMSQVHAIWQVYIIYGVLLAMGVGGLFPAAISTVARWFTEKRGMMIGIVTAGLGVGTIILSPLISHFITAYGWRWAYAILGIIVLFVVLTVSQFLKSEPEQNKAETVLKTASNASSSMHRDSFSFRKALGSRQFWMLVVAYICSGYGQFSLMVHIVPYATGMKISAISAASLVSIFGGTSIFGRLIIGGVSDRIKVKPLLTCIMTALFVSILWLGFARSYWELAGVAIIFGLGYGGSSTLQSLVAAEMFGLNSMGVMLGAFIFSICIGGSIGPVVTGFLYDQSARFSSADNYHLAFIICTVLSAISLLLVIFLTPDKAGKQP